MLHWRKKKTLADWEIAVSQIDEAALLSKAFGVPVITAVQSNRNRLINLEDLRKHPEYSVCAEDIENSWKVIDEILNEPRKETKMEARIVEKELSYRERQDIWIKENNVRKGDKIRIVRSAHSKEDGWGYFWCVEKDRRVGSILTLDCVANGDGGIVLDGNWYPYFILEKVVEEEPKFKPFDLVISIDSEDGLKELWHRFNCSETTMERGSTGSSLSYPKEWEHTIEAWNLLEDQINTLGLR